jgi:hypothetical protein
VTPKRSKQKTPQLRRFLLRLRDGRALSHETAAIDAKLIAKAGNTYANKVAFVVGTVVFTETPKSERRHMAFYEERIRELIRQGTFEVWGDAFSDDPYWMQFTEIRSTIRS